MRHPAYLPAARCVLLAMLLSTGLLAACDTVEPVSPDQLVVEAFVAVGAPLPPITLRRTWRPDLPFPSDGADGVPDAALSVVLDGQTVPYAAVSGAPGRYAPVVPQQVPPRADFTLDVRWGLQQAQATSRIPPAIALDSVRIDVPEVPVQAVLLDSLDLGRQLDSLNVNLGTEGFIYPVEVTLWWPTGFTEQAADSAYWVETLLRPRGGVTTGVSGFFLRPTQLLRERTLPRSPEGQHRWTGVYAVVVATQAQPLPPHELLVAVLRSGSDYARFAASRDTPARREPVTNLDGALGIAVGVAVDSLVLRIE